MSSPAELAGGVDVLIVAAAGGSGTQKLVSREVIDALGVDGYLVNIARGSVVDEEALVEALDGGRLAGAGLDVFADEPNVPEALLTMDNVVVLPHVASGTVQTRAAMEALTLRNLDSFLKSGQLVTPVPMPATASGKPVAFQLPIVIFWCSRQLRSRHAGNGVRLVRRSEPRLPSVR